MNRREFIKTSLCTGLCTGLPLRASARPDAPMLTALMELDPRLMEAWALSPLDEGVLLRAEIGNYVAGMVTMLAEERPCRPTRVRVSDCGKRVLRDFDGAEYLAWLAQLDLYADPSRPLPTAGTIRVEYDATYPDADPCPEFQYRKGHKSYDVFREYER